MGVDVRLDVIGPIIASAGLATAVLAFGRDTVYPSFPLRLFPGTGDGLADKLVYGAFTVAAGGSWSMNLRGGAVNDVMGAAVNWTKLKLAVIALDPDGTDHAVQFGPQGVSNTAALWFAAVTGTYKIAVRNTLIQFAPIAGWPLADGAGTLAMTNAGAADVTGRILLAGV